MLKNLIDRLGKNHIDFEVLEKADKLSGETKLKKEFHRYTPLMLAVAKSDKCLECVKLLLQNDASPNVKDEAGNNLLHLAALNGNNAILDYLSKNLKINIFERNQKGETALNICQLNKNADGTKILQQYTDEFDSSKNQAQQLLDEIEKEEAKTEKAKAQKR